MSTRAKSITVVITCTIQSGKTVIAKRELQSVIKTVIDVEKACQSIQVHEDPDNAQKLLIIERWDSKEVFLGPHMQTPHMVGFMKTAGSFLEGKADFSFWREVEV